MWRLWETLSEDALFLDIETDGRKVAEGELTVVGFYSHGEYRAYINGQNLDCDSLQQEFDDARLLVTFSGNTFDIPYLKAYYPELAIDLPHIDLCPTGHKVGLKGGLKKVEKEIGIRREDGIEGMGGYEAVLLWRAHQNNMAGALDTLVKYNREDTVNLLPLTRIICDKLKENSGIARVPGRKACAGGYPSLVSSLFSSFKTNWSGGGRKSLTTFSFTHRFVSIFYFLLHRPFSLFSNTLPRRYGLRRL